ncbi:hypothetical protein Tdes44962_MAKER03151 [Teratosphaeria destructans]|uniref:Uncharacterized protein n=1 Tax=Teratosphaeria destructans TaxID=418781 RepID=A0A9W7SQT6_9PEZI|nr:hypothetical protein Tdes44962_MAKER03151 [Teratosphaeria destructans]
MRDGFHSCHQQQRNKVLGSLLILENAQSDVAELLIVGTLGSAEGQKAQPYHYPCIQCWTVSPVSSKRWELCMNANIFARQLDTL